MKKKYVILAVIIAALLIVSPMAFAVEFGYNSARITNRYFPATVGYWNYTLGAGDSAGTVNYFNVVGIEEVSGARIGEQNFNNVKCLKANVIQTHLTKPGNFYTLWMAQDTQGNVWVLKFYNFSNVAISTSVSNVSNGTTYMLGAEFTSMFMPVVPEVGDPASITIPETASDYCRIQAVDISIDTNFGSYNSCLKTHCFHDSSTEVEYYCPDVGRVRASTVGNPQDVQDLKEYGTATVTKAVVIPLVD